MFVWEKNSDAEKMKTSNLMKVNNTNIGSQTNINWERY